MHKKNPNSAENVSFRAYKRAFVAFTNNNNNKIC